MYLPVVLADVLGGKPGVALNELVRAGRDAEAGGDGNEHKREEAARVLHRQDTAPRSRCRTATGCSSEGC